MGQMFLLDVHGELWATDATAEELLLKQNTDETVHCWKDGVGGGLHIALPVDQVQELIE